MTSSAWIETTNLDFTVGETDPLPARLSGGSDRRSAAILRGAHQGDFGEADAGDAGDQDASRTSPHRQGVHRQCR